MKQQKKTKNTPARRVSKTKPPPKVEIWENVNPIYYSGIITAIFFVIALTGILNHEMWRDELQPWLIAKESHSIPQLFYNMRFEGHPVLWHLILYFITCFTNNLFYQQLLHLLIACSFIFIFNRYSDIEIPFKILFTFGYFTLYEYTVITRDYGLAVLFIFSACAIFKNRYSHYIALGIILAVLANVSIYGVVISLSIAAILFLDYFYDKRNNSKDFKKLMIGITIVIIGVICSLYQIMPNKENTWPGFYAKELFEAPRWASIANRLFVAYFYIPKTEGIHFWNTNIYSDDYAKMYLPLWKWFTDHTEYLWAWIYLPILSLFTAFIIFLRKPLILLLYACATFGLLCVFYYTDLIHLRYCGYFLMVLIVCFWLAKYYPDKHYNNSILRSLSNAGRWIAAPFLTLVLVTNVIGAMVAYSKDLGEKFTVSKDAADYIKENKLDTLTFAGATDFTVASIAAYLDKKIYYPQMDDYGTYVIWNKKRKNDITLQMLVSSIDKLMYNERKNKLLLILTNPPMVSKDGKTTEPLLRALLAKDVKMDFIKGFEGGIQTDEKYFLYMVEKVDPAKIDPNQYQLLN